MDNFAPRVEALVSTAVKASIGVEKGPGEHINPAIHGVIAGARLDAFASDVLGIRYSIRRSGAGT